MKQMNGGAWSWLFPREKLVEVTTFFGPQQIVTRGKAVEVRGNMLRFVSSDGRVRILSGVPFFVVEAEASYERVLED